MATAMRWLLALWAAAWVWPPAAAAESAPAPLELLVLGSGGPGATGRASSCYLVLVDGNARILVDAGPGAFARLGETGQSLADTDIVLLTHLHVDHAGELAGLFKARAVAAAGPITFRVWGPAGTGPHPAGAPFPATSRFLALLFGPQGAFAYLRDFAAPIALEAHDLPATVQSDPAPRTILSTGGILIRAVPGHHGDAPAVIYRIDYGGRSITFSGDIDSQGLPGLRTLARGTDLLVFNSVVLDPPGSPQILYTLHSPPRAIGELARAADVHALLLSHLSPAVEHDEDAVRDSIRTSFAGPVSFAADRTRVRP